MKNLIAAAALLATLGSAHAQNIVVDGGFESVSQATGSWNVYSSIPGWTTTSGSGIEVRDNVAGNAYEGHNYVELDSNDNSAMAQTLTTHAGTQYTLSFEYSARTGVAASSNPISVYWDGALLGTADLDGTAQSGNVWNLYTYTVTGTGSDVLNFAAGGISDSVGGSLDAVSAKREDGRDRLGGAAAGGGFGRNLRGGGLLLRSGLIEACSGLLSRLGTAGLGGKRSSAASSSSNTAAAGGGTDGTTLRRFGLDMGRGVSARSEVRSLSPNAEAIAGVSKSGGGAGSVTSGSGGGAAETIGAGGALLNCSGCSKGPHTSSSSLSSSPMRSAMNMPLCCSFIRLRTKGCMSGRVTCSVYSVRVVLMMRPPSANRCVTIRGLLTPESSVWMWKIRPRCRTLLLNPSNGGGTLDTTKAFTTIPEDTTPARRRNTSAGHTAYLPKRGSRQSR